jgi:phage shock protein PspC (stress-responsive transcriptional regulator)
MSDQDETRRTEMDPTTAEPQATPPPVTEARRLTRRAENKLIGGVASGIADYFRIDPVLVRLAFLLLLLPGGIGILIYLIGWFVIPPNTGAPAAGEQLLRRSPDWMRWIGVGLIAFAFLGLLDAMFWFDADGFGGEFLWGIVLIGIGVYLLQRDEERREEEAPPPPAPAAEGEATAPQPAVARPKQPRPAPFLTPVTLGVALLAVGIIAILDNADVFDFNSVHYPAVVLTVLGAGLAVGSLYGRAPALLVLGIFLTPVVITASFVNVPFEGGAGERFWSASSVATVRDEYRLAMGSATLDLSNLDLDGETVEVDASIGMGELIVIVPSDVEVQATADVGIGEAVVFNTKDDGVDAVVSQVEGDGAGGTLIVNADGGLGSVEVRQEVR